MEPVVHLLLYVGLMQSSAVGRVPQQCGRLLPILTACTDDAYFGGDNVIALCHDRKGNLAVRFSVLEDLPRHDKIHLLKGQKLAGSLCRGDPTQSPIVQKLRPAVRNAPWGRLVSMPQYDAEIRRRDEFSWSRMMVFPPAASLYECKACLKLCSRVPVMNRGGEEVANLSRSVQIGVSIMKGVDGAFWHLCNQLSIQALSTILVGYHLDLATMADSNHFHDAHAGNILLSLTSKADPEIRWHDFVGTLGSSADFKVLTSQAFIDDFAGKIEQFSDIVINRIKTTHEEFATRLYETRKKCKMIGQAMLPVRSCLRKRAIWRWMQWQGRISRNSWRRFQLECLTTTCRNFGDSSSCKARGLSLWSPCETVLGFKFQLSFSFTLQGATGKRSLQPTCLGKAVATGRRLFVPSLETLQELSYLKAMTK